MGLAALHIARGEDFPVFFYGQEYMGTLEAYLAAPLVALFGPSVLGAAAAHCSPCTPSSCCSPGG